MDIELIGRLILAKLRDRGTYTVALVVGTLINVYGQFLVQWLRDVPSPTAAFLQAVEQHPGTTALSVFLGYAFPFCVGIYSAVATRYHNRRIESVADFPDRKPDPVFRVTSSGEIVEAGALTRDLFQKYGVSSAVDILGEAVWSAIRQKHSLDPGTTVYFRPEGVRYAVTCAPTASDRFNVYLARLGA